MLPSDLTSCAGETPPCLCQRPSSVFSRVTVSLPPMGSMAGLGGCHATLSALFAGISLFLGTLGPHPEPVLHHRLRFPQVSTGDNLGQSGMGGKKAEPRFWGQRTAQIEHPESTPLLTCSLPVSSWPVGSLLQGRVGAQSSTLRSLKFLYLPCLPGGRFLLQL